MSMNEKEFQILIQFSKFVSIEQRLLVHCAKRPPYKLMRLEHATFPSQKADLKITRGSDFTATKDGLFR